MSDAEKGRAGMSDARKGRVGMSDARKATQRIEGKTAQGIERGTEQTYPAFVCSDGTELAVTARCSQKARSRRLVFHHQGVIELVIPARAPDAKREMKPERVKVFLEQKRLWIERTARKLAPQIEAYRQSLAAGLPEFLDFPPLAETWTVSYHATAAARITLKLGSGTTIHLHGPVDDTELCFYALRHFVTAYAKEKLPLFAWRIVGELEAAGQLPHRPAHITVNNRKSAWGVCTRDGRIRLDRRVIFLPYALARQVVSHELAHLVHLSHQQAFYEELYSYDDSTREAERAVKRASCYVPAWL